MSTFRRALGMALSGYSDSYGGGGIPSQRLDASTLAQGSGGTWTHAGLATGTIVQQAAAPSLDTVIAFGGAASPIGVVSFWLSSTQCLVQQSGRTSALWTGLSALNGYYAVSGGGVSTAGTYKVGVAVSDKELWLTLPELIGAVGQIQYLDDLTDVSVTGAADGQRMEYDSASGLWVNVTPAASEDSKVGVDSAATPGYIGATATDGVLRTTAPLSYADGGDYVTLGLTPAGSDTEVQFNDGGVLGASEHFTFDPDTTRLSVGDAAEDTSHTFYGENLSIQRSNSYGSLCAGRIEDSAIVSGETIGQFVAWAAEVGWATILACGGLRVKAAEAFVKNTNLGSDAEVLTVPIGSATPAVAAKFGSDKTLTAYSAIESQVAAATGIVRGCYSHASAIGSGSTLASFEGAGRIAGVLGTGAGVYVVTSQAWTVGSAQGCGLQFKVVANSGTSQVTALEITQGRAVHCYGAFMVYGNGTFGDANTDTMTFTGRCVLRQLGADPLHATAGSRPAGTTGEVAWYGTTPMLYFCQNGSTPTWVRLHGEDKIRSFVCQRDGTHSTTGCTAPVVIDDDLNGYDLVGVGLTCETPGTGGTITASISRHRAGTVATGVLSTNMTIDSGEYSTATAATAAVIDTSYDDAQTADTFKVIVSAVHTSAGSGFINGWLRFRKAS